MPNIGGPELIIVLLIFVLLFGARKLPDLGRSMGQSITLFKRGLNEAKTTETEVVARDTEQLPDGTVVTKPSADSQQV
jgi:sec-independent protein translocase protein TatA